MAADVSVSHYSIQCSFGAPSQPARRNSGGYTTYPVQPIRSFLLHTRNSHAKAPGHKPSSPPEPPSLSIPTAYFCLINASCQGENYLQTCRPTGLGRRDSQGAGRRIAAHSCCLWLDVSQLSWSPCSCHQRVTPDDDSTAVRSAMYILNYVFTCTEGGGSFAGVHGGDSPRLFFLLPPDDSVPGFAAINDVFATQVSMSFLGVVRRDKASEGPSLISQDFAIEMNTLTDSRSTYT